MANRAWNRMLGAWQSFKATRDDLPESDAGTSLTRERWLLILFQELGYGRLRIAKATEIGGRTYALSHMWDQTPIHLVSFRQTLGRRTEGVRGAARVSPHSLLQEFLNRSDDHLWGFVSNGLRLRILRDNVSLSRAAYVEFDLEAMMDGEVYADFVLLWMLAHESRIEIPEGEGPEACWLEKWFQAAVEEGSRVLDHLRDGVEAAIEALGNGFLSNPANSRLRSGLGEELGTRDYYHQLLRLVYRLLFLFVAEDRGLLLDPSTPDEVRQIYGQHYSTRRLRRLADKRRGTAHGDLYRGLQIVLTRLHTACAELGLPALGGFLFSKEATADLDQAEISNYDLLDAIRHLSYRSDRHGRLPIDYRNLGAEELGSIYESLLEQHPVLDEKGRFRLDMTAGSERKTTGSYYTPSSLIRCLLDSALDPVVEGAVRGAGDQMQAEEALLNLKVCDPACGSGHFLVAAARRLAKRLAAVRTSEEEPAPEALRTALRDVIGRCIYGVDINPMAVELCKINLWMEALEPGKPLSFLDHHIQCGNSLLGTTPALMKGGIPDYAFKPIQGDDKKICSALKKRNKQERAGLQQSFVLEAPSKHLGELADRFGRLSTAEDANVASVAAKAREYKAAVESETYQHACLVADAWCAAFVWEKTGTATEGERCLTTDGFRKLEQSPDALSSAGRQRIAELRQRYGFFHWHLAFPEVFREAGAAEKDESPAGWTGGFDAVLGNPPWERIKLQEKEFFAAQDPEIARAPNAAARKRLIKALEQANPPLWAAFLAAKREAEGASHLVRDSGRYPLCGRGDINTYTIFAELMRTVTGTAGRTGCIVPSGIATDDTTKFFFQSITRQRSLVSLYHFENEDRIFPGVHHAFRFCLLTLTGSDWPTRVPRFVAFARQSADILNPNKGYTLSVDELSMINPNTGTLPLFRTRRDAEITKGIYRRVPVLIKEGPPEENPWGIKFATMFHMSNDSHLFRTREQLEGEGFGLEGNVFVKGEERWLPLYEAKMIHHFDHRYGTYEGQTEAQANQGKLPESTADQKADPGFVTLSRYWVPAEDVDLRLAGKWDRDWLLGWRDICRSTDERTVIATVFPRVGVGHKLLLALSPVQDDQMLSLQAAWSSFVLDYLARQKVGGTSMAYFIMRQLSVPTPDALDYAVPWQRGASIAEWVSERSRELNIAQDVDDPRGDVATRDGSPRCWDESQRCQLRCELDAAFFHLYGVVSEDVEYIMDTFPIVKRRDEKAYGEYRTRRMILEIYDKMAAASKSGALGNDVPRTL